MEHPSSSPSPVPRFPLAGAPPLCQAPIDRPFPLRLWQTPPAGTTTAPPPQIGPNPSFFFFSGGQSFKPSCWLPLKTRGPTPDVCAPPPPSLPAKVAIGSSISLKSGHHHHGLQHRTQGAPPLPPRPPPASPPQAVPPPNPRSVRVAPCPPNPLLPIFSSHAGPPPSQPVAAREDLRLKPHPATHTSGKKFATASPLPLPTATVPLA